jgi:hypothetical protein
MIIREILAYLGYSLTWLPLTGLFTWGLFLVLKHTGLARALAVLTSCVIVVLCLHFLESTRVFDKNDVYELIDVGVWLIVGLLFWGKRKIEIPPMKD